jgi:hypothetical protein
MITILTYDWSRRTYTVTSDAGVWRSLSPGQVPHVLGVTECLELMRVARETAARHVRVADTGTES